MANAYLNLYMGDPTEGDTDGTIVSTNDGGTPVSFTLNAAENEVKTQTLAVRCEEGYQTVGDTTISIVNDTNSRWSLSLDDEEWSSSVTITDTIYGENVTFYVRASSSSLESPSNDTSVKIRVSTQIEEN